MNCILSPIWNLTLETASEYLMKMPDYVKAFQFSENNMTCDLDGVVGHKGKTFDKCIVYNAFELESPRELHFGIAADWWVDVFLNGQRVMTTFPGGNGESLYDPAAHPFVAQGKAGKNLLAILVQRGNATWTLAFAEQNDFETFPCSPLEMTLDPASVIGPIKPMNAVNNGPIGSMATQCRSNVQSWKDAKIPMMRNHDASFCGAYGGEHTVDVHLIFPDFSKDPDDPAAYDFAHTDAYLKRTLDAGTKIFYRLGSKIEHAPWKYGTKPPADFKKWAVICEHIIRHFNEGWADGHHWDILYWEIWNEPDCRDNATWQGSLELFADLFRTAACHLKKCFPNLKIGGPSLGFDEEWAHRFLTNITTGERVPLDFFSWHIYTPLPLGLHKKIFSIRKMLDDFGYTDTESILNEWNYVRNWTSAFTYSIKTIIGMKGAAFTGACMSCGQNGPLDMLMYYDARPCVFNGLFDFYTLEPLKSYYTFLAWSKLVDLGTQIAADTKNKQGLYATAATDGNGKFGLLLSRYFEDDNLPTLLQIAIRLPGYDLRKAKVLLLDENHDLTEIPPIAATEDILYIHIAANTVQYITFN